VSKKEKRKRKRRRRREREGEGGYKENHHVTEHLLQGSVLVFQCTDR